MDRDQATRAVVVAILGFGLALVGWFVVFPGAALLGIAVGYVASAVGLREAPLGVAMAVASLGIPTALLIQISDMPPFMGGLSLSVALYLTWPGFLVCCWCGLKLERAKPA